MINIIENSNGVSIMRKTKIICTLGPSTENEDILKELMSRNDVTEVMELL